MHNQATAQSTSFTLIRDDIRSMDELPEDYENIPDDYVIIKGPNKKVYVVPEFMVPKFFLDYHSEDMKKKIHLKGTVSVISTTYQS